MSTGSDEDRSPEPGLGSARAVHRQVISVYIQASVVAIVVALLLVFLGLEFTFGQWMLFLGGITLAIPGYLVPDIILIGRHFRPLGRVLESIHAGEPTSEEEISGAMVCALNFPFRSALRVTLVHGPSAAVAVIGVLIVSNLFFEGGFQAWQIIIFFLAILFYAGPAHAVHEFFALSRTMAPTIEGLWRLGGRITAEDQQRVVSIRLKSKLLYLSICITSLPLLFFASSVIFKVQRLTSSLGVQASTEQKTALFLWVIGVSLLCIVGAAALAFLLANEVSRNASRLSRAMRKVEEGDLGVTLPVTGTDEYADLYRGFNMMTEGLQEEIQILAVTQDLTGEMNLDTLIERIMKAASELLGADRSALFLHDRRSSELFTRFAQALGTEEIRVPATAGIVGHVFQTREALNIDEPYEDPRFNPEIDFSTGYRTESILCMPVLSRSGDCIGVTQVLNKKGGNFTTRDENRLRAFTAQVAVSLENAQLFEDVLNMKNYSESILQSTADGILTLDGEGAIATANSAALTLLGVQSEEIIGKPAPDVFRDENAWVVRSIEKVALTGSTDHIVDAELSRGEGDLATVNLTSTPLVDATGESLGSLITLQDMTGEKRLKTTMVRYMSQEVADQLLESGGEAQLGGQAQTLSVLFSDVRGFTTISESLGARQTVSMLNEYFEIMVDVIFEHGGILDKYIGDAIMALFGAPFEGPNDADQAVSTANQMVKALRVLNQMREEAGKDPIDIGVGVSTGRAVVGNIGSPRRLEYTAIGDSVNLASRLEGTNKVYGTRVLISEFTLSALQQETPTREIDRLRVKGKDIPVGVYEALGHHTPETFPHLDTVLDLYSRGLEHYRRREWGDAVRCFSEALNWNPDDMPSRIHLDRAEHYRDHEPDETWDGVWILTTK